MRIDARHIAGATGLFIGLAVGIPVGAMITPDKLPPAIPAASAPSQGTSVDPLVLASALTHPAPSWQPKSLSDLMLGPSEEDEPGWSCVDDGNRVCGPNNPEGKPAGCYDLGGVLIAPWPCAPHAGSGAAPGPR
ncbi:hypothetical protein I5G62_gp61 [Mycobacterium phage CRB2]|uniref:Uncharacterized protein n=1 Tax=Mycobacterium phage CRB2 TaxID=2483623 RepID=A0A455LM77_9CAUD|nr:hypothetical protein I5G62_gp61 [Mycobacterium phage CRB2]AYP70047.1 hypothetical protein CRB2_61 [Mycobacterium phage CRB2]